ncbi:MAG: winged helix-turn-helix transcriptional regulator [Candidatus Woesearchaeota archaeon]|nr:winged helix-turn-helix transcriptional regulator [Candidatus Woesearchaeota archaeon]
MNEQLRNLLIIIGLFVLFVGTVVYSFFYMQKNYNLSTTCGCKIPIELIVMGLITMGTFTGAIVAFVVSYSRKAKEDSAIRNIGLTLNFLEQNEKKIMKAIIGNRGSMLQSEISRTTGLDKVKTTRTIKRLSEKGLVSSEKYGKTRKISASRELSELFNGKSS